MKDLYQLYRRVQAVLPTHARQILLLYALLLAALAIFDIAALGLLALIIAPISTGSDVSLPVIGPLDLEGILWTIGAICLLMISKGISSVFLLRWATQRFASYELELGNRLFRGYFRAPWQERLKKNSADLVRLIDNSVAITISSFLLPGAMLIGEAASLLAVILVLAIAQPLVAAITLVYLGFIGAVLYFWIARHARIAGRVTLTYALKNSRLITEMVGALKEITLRGKTAEVSDHVSQNRKKTTQARANVQFLGQVPRFVLDSGVVGGFLIIGGAAFFIGGISLALTSVALFALAGFRMAPSVIRFQTMMSQMISTSAHAKKVVDEIESTEKAAEQVVSLDSVPFPEDPQQIEFNNVSFRYSGATTDALHKINLRISVGSTVAFVGESGSGKSTIIDVLLSLLQPTSGEITIDGVPLSSIQEQWRSRLGYVPQDVSIFDASIAQNVALTWSQDFDISRVRDALEQAQLLTLIEQRPDGIHGSVGEQGLSLSGGQKQRLGIARALYSSPEVLVMDEATSALDTETEAAISESLSHIEDTTVVLVAHRLSTVKGADQIFYLDRGELVAQGTFDELIKLVPKFARQARLSGLLD